MTVDKKIYALALELVQGTQPKGSTLLPHTTNSEALTQDLAERLQEAYEAFCDDYDRE